MPLTVCHQETARENQNSLRLVYAGRRLYGHVLDAGCNSGFLLAHLTEAATGYVGLDESEELIALAKQRGSSLPCAFLCQDASAYEGESIFDSAFCGEVIEHLQDPQAMLASLYRLLKPKGLLVLTTPLDQGVQVNPLHEREYSMPEMQQMVREAGFIVVGAQIVSQNHLRPSRLIQILDCRKPQGEDA